MAAARVSLSIVAERKSSAMLSPQSSLPRYFAADKTIALSQLDKSLQFLWEGGEAVADDPITHQGEKRAPLPIHLLFRRSSSEEVTHRHALLFDRSANGIGNGYLPPSLYGQPLVAESGEGAVNLGVIRYLVVMTCAGQLHKKVLYLQVLMGQNGSAGRRFLAAAKERRAIAAASLSLEEGFRS